MSAETGQGVKPLSRQIADERVNEPGLPPRDDPVTHLRFMAERRRIQHGAVGTACRHEVV